MWEQPTALDFGDVGVGGHSDLTFTIRNDGGGVLAGTVTESCGDYEVPFSEAVRGLAVYNGQLVAAGDFTRINGVAVRYVAFWNGSSWQQLGAGIDARAFCVATHGNELLAGCVGGKVYRWNGGAWTALGDIGYTVCALANYRGAWVASQLGNPDVVWRHTGGTTWQQLGHQFNGNVRSLLVAGDELYCGGTCTKYKRGGTTWVDARKVMRFDDQPPKTSREGLTDCVKVRKGGRSRQRESAHRTSGLLTRRTGSVAPDEAKRAEIPAYRVLGSIAPEPRRDRARCTAWPNAPALLVPDG